MDLLCHIEKKKKEAWKENNSKNKTNKQTSKQKLANHRWYIRLVIALGSIYDWQFGLFHQKLYMLKLGEEAKCTTMYLTYHCTSLFHVLSLKHFTSSVCFLNVPSFYCFTVFCCYTVSISLLTHLKTFQNAAFLHPSLMSSPLQPSAPPEQPERSETHGQNSDSAWCNCWQATFITSLISVRGYLKR